MGDIVVYKGKDEMVRGLFFYVQNPRYKKGKREEVLLDQISVSDAWVVSFFRKELRIVGHVEPFSSHIYDQLHIKDAPPISPERQETLAPWL